MLNDGCRVGGVVVYVVPVADLRRAAVAAAVMGDDAQALGDEEQQLRVPVVRAEGPTVMKDQRLGALRPPVLVENRDAVFRRDGIHGYLSCVASGCALNVS